MRAIQRLSTTALAAALMFGLAACKQDDKATADKAAAGADKRAASAVPVPASDFNTRRPISHPQPNCPTAS